jgi:glycosyltransferase involved in cell wall biosynthesis
LIDLGGERAVDVSVVIPVHNREHLLPTTLSGVGSQVHTLRMETIVVDDASSDGSSRVAAAMGARVVRLDENVGPGAARQAGARMASGGWIAFLDSDDCWGPDHIATLWKARNGHVLVSSSGVTAGPGGVRVLGSPFLRPVVLRHPGDVMQPENLIPTGGVIVRTDALRAAGEFGQSRHSEDLEVWTRMLRQGTGVVLPDLTVAYRRHEGQASRDKESMWVSAKAVMQAFEGEPWFDSRFSRMLRTTAVWDQARAGGESLIPTLLGLCRSGAALDLLRLLARRAQRRHRWRLDAVRTRQLLALLADDGKERSLP